MSMNVNTHLNALVYTNEYIGIKLTITLDEIG